MENKKETRSPPPPLSYAQLRLEVLKGGHDADANAVEEVLEVGEEAVARGGDEVAGSAVDDRGGGGRRSRRRGRRRRSSSVSSSSSSSWRVFLEERRRTRRELRRDSLPLLLGVAVVFLSGRHCGEREEKKKEKSDIIFHLKRKQTK